MKKLLRLLPLPVLLCLAAYFLYPQLSLLGTAGASLKAGAYVQAAEAYESVLAAGAMTPFFSEKAEAGLVYALEGAASEKADGSSVSFSAGLLENAISLTDSEALHSRAEAAVDILTATPTPVPTPAPTPEPTPDPEKVKAEQVESEAMAAANAGLYGKAMQLADEMPFDAEREKLLARIMEMKETALSSLQQQWTGRLGAGTWYTLLQGETVSLAGDSRYETSLPAAEAVFCGDFGILLLNNGVPSFYGDTLGAAAEASALSGIVTGAVGMNHALLVKDDGTVVCLGAKQFDKGAVENWVGIAAVAAGANHSIGLTSDGHVTTAGLNLDGQCDTKSWENIISVAAGFRHTVGLKADGTVVACGDNSLGQCNVGGWSDIVAVACGGCHTLGLKSDGTVVAAGDNSALQCSVDGWSHVLTIAAGSFHSAALLEDGRIICCGANDRGQCDTENMRAFAGEDITALPATVKGNAQEYVYIGDERTGPWLYYAGDGAVSISWEDTYELVATRADLYCTSVSVPEGILSGGGDSPRSTEQGTTLAKQNHAVFAINGDYFNFGYNPDGVQIRRGKVFKNEISDKKSSVGFAFWPDNTMRLVNPMETDADMLLSLGIRDSWVFGPTLILNGEVQDISYSPLSYNDITLRSAIGSVCGYHHIAVSCGSATLAELTQLFMDYGCDIAYNLDGGRSVWMTFMGKRVNRTYYSKKGTRNLSDMIGFLHSDSVK